ncbi:MAG TPA: hypothetical protein VHB79_05565 [Polyangiaceae bacterium]|nr:hypothetical protein [Polyangiaceae bacterium]
MRRRFWLLTLACALSCSSRDQSLGETHPSPRPVINPIPTPTPTPTPDPNPDPTPTPDPNPTPTTPPCEDSSKHASTGQCLPPGDCKRHVLSIPGYECSGNLVCCNDAPGCSQFGCGNGGSGGNGGGGSGGSVSQGGETSTDGVAGAGGAP